MSDPFDTQPARPLNPPHAIRFEFAYDAAGIRFISARRLLKRTRPTEKPITGERSGFWVEMRTSHGKLLYTRSMHPPFAFDREIPPDKPGGTFSRVPDPNARGTFSILLPDILEADVLIIYSSPLRPEAGHLPAKVQVRLARNNDNADWKEG